MPSFTDLTSDRATVTIPTRSDPLVVHYRPGAVTPRQVAMATRFQGVDPATLTDAERAQANDMSIRLLANMVIGWNLTAPDGTPIEPTLDGLQDVDYAAQSYIIQAIMEDQRGPKSTPPAADSVDGSIAPTAASSTGILSAAPLADSSQASPTGMASSPSLTSSRSPS